MLTTTEQIKIRSGYMPKPFYKMTDDEAMRFAMRQATEASETTRFATADGPRSMTNGEVEMYAGAVFSAIQYFNRRDRRHAAEMNFLRDCKARQDAQTDKGMVPSRRNEQSVYII